ncbi:hypothetical protein B0T13DRAFT_454212 [Neurospora crassa]|nr:hypothetical protein B0T13DRAFT_454212 [Neurospora crassa]
MPLFVAIIYLFFSRFTCSQARISHTAISMYNELGVQQTGPLHLQIFPNTMRAAVEPEKLYFWVTTYKMARLQLTTVGAMHWQ